eukprot:scaffold2324_cov116-Cylindrotheca_fusiformis.AAC.11
MDTDEYCSMHQKPSNWEVLPASLGMEFDPFQQCGCFCISPIRRSNILSFPTIFVSCGFGGCGERKTGTRNSDGKSHPRSIRGSY